MEAKELRIGNWLNGNYNGFSKDIKIYNFTRHKIQHTDEKQIPTSIGNFKPIPLTEDWLLKFGFEKSKQPNGAIFYSKDRFRVLRQSEDSGLFNMYDYFRTIVFINHVHSLQNLYFALTENELKL